jgi:hypothetical protein
MPTPTLTPLVQEQWAVVPGVIRQETTSTSSIVLPNGKVHTYFLGFGIGFARSSDGRDLSSVVQTNVRPSPGGEFISNPAVLRRDDGTFLLVYERSASPPPNQGERRLYRAFSSDGITFGQAEVLPSTQLDRSPQGEVFQSVPDLVRLQDGSVRLYYVAQGASVGSMISRDGGGTWTPEPGYRLGTEVHIRAAFVDPDVVLRPDGTFVMYIAYSEFERQCGGLGCQRILAAYSPDGFNFILSPTALVSPPSVTQGAVDPDVYQMPDGRWHMLYGEGGGAAPYNLRVAERRDTGPASQPRAASTPTATPAPTATSGAACLPPGTDPQGALRITPVTGNTMVPGADLWFFVVDDGSPQPAVSAERPGNDGGIFVGRLNLAAPGAPLNWHRVASSADTGGRGIADHWHVFAHGHHWIVFSAHEFPPPPGQSPDRFSYLLKLDTAFRRVALVPVVLNSTEPTNDMFLVAEADGIAVSVFRPTGPGAPGLRLYRFDVEGRSRGSVTIGGAQYSHGNGSSALPLESGYLELATETLQPNATSAVKGIVYDAAWQPKCAVALIDESGTNAAMPSGVRLPSGTLVVTLRIITGVIPRGTQAPMAQPGVTPDSGAIVRLVVASNGRVVNRETMLERTTAAASGNRPHIVLIGDLLVTSWDTSGSIWIRMDRISTG